MKVLFFPVFILALICKLSAQGPELKSIEEVISGIDSLLEEIDRSSEGELNQDTQITEDTNNLFPEPSRSFRVENELLPEELRSSVNEVPVNQVGMPSSNEVLPPPLYPAPNPSPVTQPSTLPRSVDYSQMSLDDLLREVDMLRKPSSSPTGSLIEPLPVAPKVVSDEENPQLLLPTKEYVQQALPEISPVVLPDPSSVSPREEPDILVEDYIVLGDEIDQEMKEKIREAIMATRMASGGTGNPFVTRTVYKATSYCNRVLGRLTAPNHKRYRRDLLLAMMNMHEKNQAWVDAAKSYERFLAVSYTHLTLPTNREV